MRRRRLLSSVIVLGTGLVVTTAASGPAAAAGPLEELLPSPPEGAPVPLFRLEAELALGAADFRAARYGTLGARLPRLVRGRCPTGR